MFEFGDTVNLGDSGLFTLNERCFAVMQERSGETVDVAYSYDSAESMVLEGYIACPVGIDNYIKYSPILNALQEVYADCWLS